MKKLFVFTFVAAVAAMTMMSCQKEQGANSFPKVEASTETPAITFSSATNIFDVPANTLEYTFKAKSSVPATFTKNDVAYSGECHFGIEGKTQVAGEFDCKIFNINGVAGKAYDYTFDNCFSLVQDIWGDVFYDFTNYGLVETLVNFRVRGTKGTRYLDLSLPKYDDKEYSTSNSYFIKGEVKAISNVKTETKDFGTYKAFELYFKGMNYTPAQNYSAESVDVTIETETGTATITVFGKARDKEIANLQKKMAVGKTVEVPALFKDGKAIADKKFNAVPSCSVLVVE